eukprot:Ihof_evm1s1003 gene=Ihof_evmTU1s1003
MSNEIYLLIIVYYNSSLPEPVTRYSYIFKTIVSTQTESDVVPGLRIEYQGSNSRGFSLSESAAVAQFVTVHLIQSVHNCLPPHYAANTLHLVRKLALAAPNFNRVALRGDISSNLNA